MFHRDIETELRILLKKYWGYESFRPLQLEIIESVLTGKDTLALLPTGGGKSVCFQVPALFNDGLCLVVSPLIALMKDQVEQLRNRNISAAAIHSGMSKTEVDVTLEKCVLGKFKFLYLSPERLATEIFKARVVKMKINLIAVDEAHCISQWGYDFRPPYLQIAGVRELLKGVPLMALTASATPEVCDDIMQKLLFKESHLIRKSFERKNLSYSVLFEEDKNGRLLRMLQKVKGSALVYVRNRKRTLEIAKYLNQNNISAAHYHAGLSFSERSGRQDSWINNKLRVIVCTNAFGMGIDKPDVRLVVHYDAPDNIESYFQEAGRAGRDEKKSFAVMLYQQSDITDLKLKVSSMFPETGEVRRVYDAAGNYCRLALGSGHGQCFDFNINGFLKAFKLPGLKTIQALKILEQEGFLSYSDSVFLPSRLTLLVTRENLYRFEVLHPEHEALIKTIMRSYGGVFDYITPIREEDLASALGISYQNVIMQLEQLHQARLIQYEKRNENPQMFFMQPRVSSDQLTFNIEWIEKRKKCYEQRVNAMVNYLTDSVHCRSMSLLHYFSDYSAARCGICDVCVQRKRLELNDIEFENIASRLQMLLSQHTLPLSALMNYAKEWNEEKFMQTLRWLIDQGMISENENHEFRWNQHG